MLQLAVTCTHVDLCLSQSRPGAFQLLNIDLCIISSSVCLSVYIVNQIKYDGLSATVMPLPAVALTFELKYCMV